MINLLPALATELPRLAAEFAQAQPRHVQIEDCFDTDASMRLLAALRATRNDASALAPDTAGMSPEPLAAYLRTTDFLDMIAAITGVQGLVEGAAATDSMSEPATEPPAELQLRLQLIFDLVAAPTPKIRCLIVDASEPAALDKGAMASLRMSASDSEPLLTLDLHGPVVDLPAAPELPPYARLSLYGVGTAHPTGHYYSPVCDPADLVQRRDEIWPAQVPECLGIDFDDESHRRVLEQWFPRFIGDYDYPEHGPEDNELQFYYTQNSQFSWLDSRALFVLMRALQPRRIIEVGSGYSSLLMADVNRRHFDGAIDIRCVEPYPREFLTRGVPGIKEVIVERVQQVPLATFEALEANDILFIDSSHVGKTGSDVNYLFFEVLPRLKSGVVIHVHDIFLPAEYLQNWAIDENRSWNEQYLLRALLMYSTAFKPMFGCYYAWLRHQERVRIALAHPKGRAFGGGSFWLRRQ